MFWTFGSGKSAGSRAIAKPVTWYAYTFIEPLPGAGFKYQPVPSNEMDNIWEFRPQEGAIGEYAAPNNGITSKALLPYEPFNNGIRILREVDASDAVISEVSMVRERVIAKTHVMPGAFNQGYQL